MFDCNFTFDDENNPNNPDLFFDFPPLTVCRKLPFSGIVCLLGVNKFPLCPSPELCDSLKSVNAMSEGIGKPDLYLSTTAFESCKINTFPSLNYIIFHSYY